MQRIILDAIAHDNVRSPLYNIPDRLQGLFETLRPRRLFFLIFKSTITCVNLTFFGRLTESPRAQTEIGLTRDSTVNPLIGAGICRRRLAGGRDRHSGMLRHDGEQPFALTGYEDLKSPPQHLARQVEVQGSCGPGAQEKMIAALARKLLIDPWRFVEDGVVPTGVELSDAAGS